MNREGPEPTDRLILRDLYNELRRKMLGEDAKKSYIFFIDYMLQRPGGEPQILAISNIARDPGKGVEVFPVFTSEFWSAWKASTVGEELEDAAELVDIWKKEHVDHLNTANSG